MLITSAVVGYIAMALLVNIVWWKVLPVHTSTPYDTGPIVACMGYLNRTHDPTFDLTARYLPGWATFDESLGIALLWPFIFLQILFLGVGFLAYDVISYIPQKVLGFPTFCIYRGLLQSDREKRAIIEQRQVTYDDSTTELLLQDMNELNELNELNEFQLS